MNTIKVSICCITYNQRLYIEDALNSFLAQETTFDFEIIIGNDNSTDGTLEILLEYKKKHPSKIKLINNQQTLGSNKNALNVMRMAKGEFIALCEADDYWTDTKKLQKQYDMLINNEHANMCVHKAYVHDYISGMTRSPKKLTKNIYLTSDVISCGGALFPTSSYMIRKIVIKKLPLWFTSANIGDWYLEIYSTKDSCILAIDEAMSVYRSNATNSWTETRKKSHNYNVHAMKDIVRHLMRCSFDFPLLKNEIAISISKTKLSLASVYLMHGKYVYFRCYLKASATPNMKASRKQKIYMILKWCPLLLVYLHLLQRTKQNLYLILREVVLCLKN